MYPPFVPVVPNPKKFPIYPPAAVVDVNPVPVNDPFELVTVTAKFVDVQEALTAVRSLPDTVG